MLRQRIAELIEQHGSLRAAARVLMVDPGYLSRLASGEKDDPGEDLLRRMKLRRVVAYERTASTGADTARHAQDDHAGSPAPSRVDLPARVVDTVAASVGLSGPFGQDFYDFAQALMMEVLARVPAPSAHSSKAALSDDDARLSEDDLHARSWWCPTCKKDVPPEMVTKDGEHYLEAGGCGYAVRGELIEDQPKQPLSDEEIKAAAKQAGFLFHTIPEYAPIQHTLPEEFSERCFYRFARAILARAGIGESRHE